MRKRIRKDLERFKRIVRGELRKNLAKFIESGEIIGQKGKDVIKVPLKGIRIPEFRYDPRAAGGLGAGPGEIGQVVRPDPEAGRDGSLQPGRGPGFHFREVEVELRELAEILGEALQLPRIEPKGQRLLDRGGEDYTDVATIGPASLLMKRRAYRRGLLRQMWMAEPGPGQDAQPVEAKAKAKPCEPLTVVTPIKEDLRFLHSEPHLEPQANVVIFFLRDASGSMTPDKTEIIRQENYWIDLWLRTHYDHIARVYLLHDYEAQEVSEEDFYRLSTGGGTRISSAYELCDKLIERRYPPADWNIYGFHFSDGENWIGDTENVCVPLLRERLLPKCNLFCYGQVTLGKRAPGLHLVKLQEHLGEEETLLTSIISSKEDILPSIKTFLGTGR